MKPGTRQRLLLSVATACVMATATVSRAQQAPMTDSLDPYQMLRSLQFVQDTVVMGDHSAGEMQRFMLSALDQRLRAINAKAFDDPRNVDAALIFAMSGGNPATLEYLIGRDVAGNFDTRVADVLRKYLAGKGLLVANTLANMVPEYRSQRIGPYLALVAGNVTIAKDPKKALDFYDWARLMAPGTIVEEAALRRSVAIAVDANMPEKGLNYSRQYARRFIHSPYASQFADLFVKLVVGHYGVITLDDLNGALEVMSDDRAQEIYVRIARQATIAGMVDLAREASQRAEERSAGQNRAGSTAKLLSGVANLSQGEVSKALQAITDVPEDQLSPEDRALKAAAQRVAEEVTRPPEASLEQETSATMTNQISAEQTSALTGNEASGSPAAQGRPAPGNAPTLDPDFKSFIDRGRSSLSAIDEMLKKDN